jgi:heme/copper-type cytochrome/quinol oxidase subunit 2
MIIFHFFQQIETPWWKRPIVIILGIAIPTVIVLGGIVYFGIDWYGKKSRVQNSDYVVHYNTAGGSPASAGSGSTVDIQNTATTQM